METREHSPFAEVHFYLTVRCAALLVAYNGRVHTGKFKELAKDAGYLGSLRNQDGTSHGSLAGRAARNAINDLVEFGLARRIENGREVISDNVKAVIEWMALQTADGYTPNLGAPQRITQFRNRASDAGYLLRKEGLA